MGNLRFVLALAATALAGMLVAAQSRINGGLSVEISNGYVAAFVSFGSGFIIIGLVLASSRRGRTGLAKLRRELGSGRLPKWALLGGLCGAVFVLSQGLVAPLTGLALFTVGIVAGQVLGGLVMDRLGLGPSGRIQATPTRLVGTALAIAAVIVSVSNGVTGGIAVLVVIPVLIGALLAAQSMMNGVLRSAAESAVTATFVSFGMGTAALLVAAIVSVAVGGWPVSWPTEPWYYVGGALGTIFIALSAMLVRTVGVLLLSMANVAGQMLAAVAIDVALPLGDDLTVPMVVGALIALIAVLVAALPSRKLGNASG